MQPERAMEIKAMRRVCVCMTEGVFFFWEPQRKRTMRMHVADDILRFIPLACSSSVS